MATQIPHTHAIYDKVLEMHALRYLKMHQGMDLIFYLELHATGPISNAIVAHHGVQITLQLLEEKIEELR